MSLSKESFTLEEAFLWDVEGIKRWLKATTSLKPEMKPLWTDIFEPHFEKQTSYGRGFNDNVLIQMSYPLHNASLKINSCFCALAWVINHALPPYDPAEGSTDEYAFSVLILTVKWSKLIGDAGPDPYRFPLFFSVFCIEKEHVKQETMNDLVLIVGTTNSLNIKGDELGMREEWQRSRMVDLAACFGDDKPNNPHPLDPENVLGREEEPVTVYKEAKSLSKWRAPNKPEDVRACIEKYKGCLLSKTMEIYLLKRFPKPNDKAVKQGFGSCAETYGFIISAGIVKPGGHAKLFSIAAEDALCVAITSGYKTHATYPKPSKPPKFKPRCDNCLYISSALEAKYGFTIEESKYQIEGRPLVEVSETPDPILPEEQADEACEAAVTEDKKKKRRRRQKKGPKKTNVEEPKKDPNSA